MPPLPDASVCTSRRIARGRYQSPFQQTGNEQTKRLWDFNSAI
jgi:hypothetical protein